MVVNLQTLGPFLDTIFRPGAVFYLQSREISFNDATRYHNLSVLISGAVEARVEVEITLHFITGAFPHQFFETLMHSECIGVPKLGEHTDTVCFQHADGLLFLYVGGIQIPLNIVSCRRGVENVEHVNFRGHLIPVHSSQKIELELEGMICGAERSDLDGDALSCLCSRHVMKKEEKRPSRKLNIPGVNC